MPMSEKPKCSSSDTRTGAHIRNGSARPRPTAGESNVRTGSSSSKRSKKAASRHSTSTVSQTAEKGQLLKPPKNASMRELTRPTSGLQGSQVAAALPKAPVDAESQASLCALKSSVHHNTSRVPSGAASPSWAELLPGLRRNRQLGRGPSQHIRRPGPRAVPTPGSDVWNALRDSGEEENRTALPCHEWGYDIANKADSIVSRFDLVCDRKYLYDLSSLAPIVGSALVAPLLGLASDHVGRKPVMLFCAIVQLLTTVACSFSQTYTFFVCTRVLLFVAADVTFLNTFVLIHEVTGNAHRSTFTILDTAVPGMIVPPLMHALSLLEPRWMLAQALPVLGGVVLAAWCYLQEESPAWLIDTRHTARAERVLLLAAKENGVDVAKARKTFTVIKEQLYKLDEDPPRCGCSGSRIGGCEDATSRDFRPPGQVVHVFAFAAYVASICVCIRRYGVKETLSSLLVILSAFCVLETLAIFADQHTLIRFVHEGLKVAVSGATAVTFCYTAETFPTAVRNAGISLAHLAGGVGNVVAIAVILLSEPHAGHVFYAMSAFMVLLSVAAIQWLPEVYVERPLRAGSLSSLSVQERKAALVASLTSGIRSHRNRESKARYSVPY
ncbi:hypothetical protein MTO96_025524 [Rhipicephalus appendiculatus]